MFLSVKHHLRKKYIIKKSHIKSKKKKKFNLGPKESENLSAKQIIVKLKEDFAIICGDPKPVKKKKEIRGMNRTKLKEQTKSLHL